MQRNNTHWHEIIIVIVWLEPLAQVWTHYLTNWIWLLDFYWISNFKDYLNFNLSCTLGLKNTKPSSRNATHWSLFNNIESVPPISLQVFFIIQFSMKKIFNIQ
jgi:hypothetical protein